ncbi:hypothetical protein BKA56DRAFT_597505 [Ilyonectria sp. MPI-CAGE-AT-0026]|nr:hypothetical protein BKA56DRAFT_597505 [Ilyonectria sp. MPI-CAGE-AT-0026]
MHFKIATIFALAAARAAPTTVFPAMVNTSACSTDGSDSLLAAAPPLLPMCTVAVEAIRGGPPRFPTTYYTYYPYATVRGGDCIMYPGAPYWPVRRLQEALQKCYGLDWLNIDGRYGPETTDAVMVAQYWSGLPQTGTWGPQTGSRMGWPLHLEFGTETPYCL